jgi:hypothetical protein
MDGTIMNDMQNEVIEAAAKVVAAWDRKKYLKEPIEELREVISRLAKLM